MKYYLLGPGYLLLPCFLFGLAGCKCNPPYVPPQDLQPPPAVQNPALPLEKIVEMTKSGLGPSIIINQIRSTGSTYMLSVEQITWLKQQGVSDEVIMCMQTGGRGGAPPAPQAVASPAVVGPAYVAAPPAVVVAPGPYYYGYGPGPYYGRGYWR